MPDSRLTEIWKTWSWNSNFKSFDIKEETPGEKIGSNEGFSFPLFSFNMSDIKICLYADENDTAEREKWWCKGVFLVPSRVKWKSCAFDWTHFEVLMPSALSYCFSLSFSLSVSCRKKKKKGM